jgi:ATP adenylyltransferase
MLQKRIWAPWRMTFIENAGPKGAGCIFCSLPAKGANVRNLVLHKGHKAFVILNRYPYASGHLMVVPYRHIGSFEKLTNDEYLEMSQLVAQSISILKKRVRPQGFNVGLNLGRVAGAGIDKHVHYHVVPRWSGDTNMMPVIGCDVRVLPEALGRTYKKLAPDFRKIK